MGQGTDVIGSGYSNPLGNSSCTNNTPPEKLLAKMLKDDLGVEIEPQALRMFIRFRWDRVQKAAHAIHAA